jgi:Family of unknown function (DUF6069)
MEKLIPPSLPKAVGIAAVAAAGANAVLFLIGSALRLIDPFVTVNGQAILLPQVVMASIVPTLIAGLLLWALNRFTQRPLRIFNTIAIVFLLFSLSGPFTGLKDAPLGMALWLNLLHLAAGGIVLYCFNRLTKKAA